MTDIREKIAASFAAQGLMATLGAQLVHIHIGETGETGEQSETVALMQATIMTLPTSVGR